MGKWGPIWQPNGGLTKGGKHLQNSVCKEWSLYRSSIFILSIPRMWHNSHNPILPDTRQLSFARWARTKECTRQQTTGWRSHRPVLALPTSAPKQERPQRENTRQLQNEEIQWQSQQGCPVPIAAKDSITPQAQSSHQPGSHLVREMDKMKSRTASPLVPETVTAKTQRQKWRRVHPSLRAFT